MRFSAYFKIFPIICTLMLILSGVTPLYPHTKSLPEKLRKFTIEDIEFEFKTTRTFDNNTLLDVLGLSKKTYFIPEELEEDRERIKKFYFDNGFFDAVIDTRQKLMRAG
jgi:outer membrane protein assembly factor BamA